MIDAQTSSETRGHANVSPQTCVHETNEQGRDDTPYAASVVFGCCDVNGYRHAIATGWHKASSGFDFAALIMSCLEYWLDHANRPEEEQREEQCYR